MSQRSIGLKTKSTRTPSSLAGTGDKPGAFVSYARGNDALQLQYKFALLIERQLNKLGIDSFIDTLGVAAGENWKERVQSAIFSPQRFTVLLLSPEFVLSYPCRQEHSWARQHAVATGKRVIPIMLKSSRSVQEFVAEQRMQDLSWLSLEKLYAAFLIHKGKELTQRWQADFRAACDATAAAIRLAHHDYASRIHTYLAKDYTDPYLEKSGALFERYPENYRDPFKRVQGWIAEGLAVWYAEGPEAGAPNFPRELYLIASYCSRPVGVLYATLYPGKDDRTPICLVQVMSVEGDAVTAELDRLELLRDGSIPDKLLGQLKREIHQLSPRCKLVFAVLPKVAAKAGRPILNCWRAWAAVRPDAAYALQQCPSFRFIQPDMGYEGEEKHTFAPEEASLVFLTAQDQALWITRSQLEKTLELLYWVVYAETYFNPYCIRHWWQHISRIYRRSAAALKRLKLQRERLPLEPLKLPRGLTPKG